MRLLLSALLCGMVYVVYGREIVEIDLEIRSIEQSKEENGIEEDCLLPTDVDVTWCSVTFIRDGFTYVGQGATCVFTNAGLRKLATCQEGYWSFAEWEEEPKIRKKRSHTKRCVRRWLGRRCTQHMISFKKYTNTFCEGVNHTPYFTRCTPPTTTFYVPGGSTSMRLTWQEPRAFDDEDGLLRPSKVRTKYRIGQTRSWRIWGRKTVAKYARYPHYGEVFKGSQYGTRYPVSYRATDRNWNCVTCTFTVSVKISHCSAPRPPSRGSVYCPSGTKAGDVCRFSCNTGYRATMASTTCRLDGSWTHGSRTICTAISCSTPLPTFPNGRYVCSSYSYGKCCYPSCNDGYTLTSKVPITCRSSGWYRSSLPTCEDKQAPVLVNCPSGFSVTAKPRETSAEVSWTPPTATDEVDGSIVDITRFGIAPDTIQGVGNYAVVYQALDSAGNPGQCSFIVTVKVTRCNPMSTAHGSYTCSHDNLLGSECTWTCSNGFSINGSTTTTCASTGASTGAWTDAIPTCTAVVCPPPSDLGHTFKHGNYSCPSPITFGDICQSTCETGFGQSIASIAVCSISDTNRPDYEISTVPACTDKMPPEFTNCRGTQVLFTAEKGATSAVVTWEKPFAKDNLDTSPVVTKISGPSNGSRAEADDNTMVEWQAIDSAGNPSAICLWTIVVNVIECPRYIPPNHGQISCDNDYIYGSVCTLTCNVGYEVSDSEESECFETKSWSNQLSCSASTCSGPPSSFDNGDYECSEATYPYNSMCNAQCNERFELQSKGMAKCNGTAWEYFGSPVCTDIKPPVIVDCRGEISLVADILTESAIVNVTTPTATDNLDPTPVVYKISGPANGERLVGTGIITYQAVDSAGNPSSVCITVVTVNVIECPAIPWPSSAVLSYSHNRIYGSTCLFSCDTGYTITNGDTVTCGSDGTWSFVDDAPPVCQKIRCSDPKAVTNGLFSCPSLTYESVCILQCDKGFVVSHVSFATCRGNGQWDYSSEASCEDAVPPVITGCKSYQRFYAEKGTQSVAVVVQLPNVTDNHDTNIALTQISGKPSGSRLDVGMHLVEYTATDAAENPASAACRITIVVEEVVCLTPSQFPDSQLHFECQSHTWGATCDVICMNTTSKSYELTGSSTMTCEAYFYSTILLYTTWNASDEHPMCIEIVEPTCAKNLPVPANGGLNYVNEEALPIAFPFCKASFDLPYGSDTQILCLDTGYWKGTVQDCTVLLHPSLSVLSAGFQYTGKCTSETNMNAIKEAVLAALEAFRGTDYAPACLETYDCDFDELTVVCAETGRRVRRSATIAVNFTMNFINPVESATDLVNNQQTLFDLATAMNKSIADGQFNIVISGIVLTVEPSTFFRDANANPKCDVRFVLDGIKCKPCGRGAYLVIYENGTSECQSCPVGTFNDQEAAKTCTVCPTGYSTLTPRSTSLDNCTEQCEAFHFSDTGLKPCSPCPIGFYQHSTGQTRCNKCPIGTTTFSGNRSCQGFDLLLYSGHYGIPTDNFPSQMEALSISFWYLAYEDSSLTVFVASQTITFFSIHLDSTLAVYVEGSNLHVPIVNGAWAHVVVTSSSESTRLYQNGDVVLSLPLALPQFTIDTAVTLTINTSEYFRLTGVTVYPHVFDDPDRETVMSTCEPNLPGAILTTEDIYHLGIIIDASTCLALDPCSEQPCGEGNQCSLTNSGSVVCICLNGFSGPKCKMQPDNCGNITCLNGGSCMSMSHGFVCQCPEGYAGTYCGLAPVDGRWSDWSRWSDCSAICDGGTMYRNRSCDSPPPSVSGRQCEGQGAQQSMCNENKCEDASPCSVAPCGVDHLCSEQPNGGFICKCLHGYTGTRCETTPESCDYNNCLNNASCQGSPSGTYNCLCATGYTGEYCEYEATFSSFWTEWTSCSASCNGGISIRERVCDPPLQTDFCSETVTKTCNSASCIVDHCQLSPCGNNTCVSRGHTYSCLCGEGYTGVTCSEQLCSCVHGHCISMDDGQQTCSCNAGYDGSLCELKSVNGGWSIWEKWTDCSATCGEGQRQRSRSCDNPSPYNGGLTCEGGDMETITCIMECSDVCRHNECGTGHNCVQNGLGFRCHCNHGYTGDRCQTPPDPCSPSPCLNDGICRIEETDFICTCTGGHAGETCEIGPDDSRWSPWEGWGECTVSCGGGSMERIRLCEHGTEGTPCEGASNETTPCNEELCPGCLDLPRRYGMSMNCTVKDDLHICELKCEPGYQVANGSIFLPTYTCGPDTGFEWDQIVEVPSCSPIELPEEASSTSKSTISPPIPCDKLYQVKTSVAGILSKTPCAIKSMCTASVTLDGCETSSKKRSVEKSSTLSFTIALNIAEGRDNSTNETDLYFEMDADGQGTFNTLTSISDLSVDGNVYSTDMDNVTVDGLIKCRPGSFLSDGDTCVGCAPGSYYNSTFGFCVYCPEGTYQELPGQAQCTNCGQGYATNFTGSWQIFDCFEIPIQPTEAPGKLALTLGLAIGVPAGFLVIVGAFLFMKRQQKRHAYSAEDVTRPETPDCQTSPSKTVNDETNQHMFR